jgi:hypothetical protein
LLVTRGAVAAAVLRADPALNKLPVRDQNPGFAAVTVDLLVNALPFTVLWIVVLWMTVVR